MTDDRKAGIALIAGSLGGILAMAIHPGQAWLPIDHPYLSILSGTAHSVAMLSVLLLFLGLCRLAQRLAARDRLSFAAIVTYGFACVAAMIAAAVSGFIMPNILARMARDVPAAAHQWQILIAGIFQINQAFARIFAVATSLAIVLWSGAALRNGGLGRGVAIYGCIIGSLITIGIAIGHLRLDVHGMGIVALGQVVWFICVGYRMVSAKQPPTAE
jgi:hypothetical protein